MKSEEKCSGIELRWYGVCRVKLLKIHYKQTQTNFSAFVIELTKIRGDLV